MSIMEFVFKVELNDAASLQKLEGMIGLMKRFALGEKVIHENTESCPISVTVQNNANTQTQPNPKGIIRKFYDQASSNQRDVLDWMKQNPGRPISGYELRSRFPILKPKNAISGVLNKKAWYKLGGDTDSCPFAKVGTDRKERCILLRGLTAEEVQDLSN